MTSEGLRLTSKAIHSESGKEVPKEIGSITNLLLHLRAKNKLLVAVLYGSFSNGNTHARSDIDLAIYLNAISKDEEIAIIDKILESTDREVSILRLDDEEESSFIIQEALKGVHLVEPDKDALYKTAFRALRDAESIRFRRRVHAKMVHQYIRINWQNIVTVKSRVPDIRLYSEKAKDLIRDKS